MRICSEQTFSIDLALEYALFKWASLTDLVVDTMAGSLTLLLGVRIIENPGTSRIRWDHVLRIARERRGRQAIRPHHHDPSIASSFSCESSSRAIKQAGGRRFDHIITIHQLHRHSHMNLHHEPSSKRVAGDSTKSTRPNEPNRTNTSTSPALSGASPRLIRPLGSLDRVVSGETARSPSADDS